MFLPGLFFSGMWSLKILFLRHLVATSPGPSNSSTEGTWQVNRHRELRLGIEGFIKGAGSGNGKRKTPKNSNEMLCFATTGTTEATSVRSYYVLTNTVQFYMKEPESRTLGQQENNNFCSINIGRLRLVCHVKFLLGWHSSAVRKHQPYHHGRRRTFMRRTFLFIGLPRMLGKNGISGIHQFCPGCRPAHVIEDFPDSTELVQFKELQSLSIITFYKV